ncbi:hypothetical protein L6164_026525 [Bauhinia variegata]|uniref:Uncharacterized protein n=1 Tax=Bauhinia variegata TaxID=167791 RepID=A0ACB9LQG3_BAUVA|nr:hypothetical protein L6164_026525 [Bauhinia variegata]
MKSPLLSPRPQKKLKVGRDRDLEPRSSLKRNHLHVQTEKKSINGNARVKSTKKELGDMGGNVLTNKKCPNSEHKTRMQRPLTFTQKTEALKRAETFRSDKPFFSVVIQRSYLSNNSLHIPSKFAQEHIENKQGDVMLEVSKGRTWSATYNNGKLRSGWHKFAKDNNLKVGDACVFEMTNSIELSLKVSIYQALEVPSCSFSQVCTERLLENFTTERKKSILIRVGERQWHINLICDLQQEGSSSRRFSAGWTAFSRENNLKVGDACIFELIKRDDAVLDAHIFRCNS